MSHCSRLLFLALCFLSVSQFCAAEDSLRLARVFNDHMVLQREMTVPVWGWASAGSTVQVQFASQELSSTAGDDGYWRVNLKPMDANNTAQALTVTSGEHKISIKDVLIGEVWFCAGQSNMAGLLGMESYNYPELKARIGEMNLPRIRFLNIGGFAAKEPLADLDPVAQKNTWVAMDKNTAKNSMTMPFFFSRTIQNEIDVPFGLIQVAIGGTTQTAWSPKAVLEEVHNKHGSKLNFDTLYKASVEKQKKAKRASDPKSWDAFEEQLAQWKANGAKGRHNAGSVKHFPTVLHNAQIAPFIPFAFRGMLWHQGEGGPSEEHGERMVALVNGWRKLFGHDFHYFYGALGRGTLISPPFEPIAQSHYRINRNQSFLTAQRLFGYDNKAFFIDFSDRGNFETHWGEKDRGGYQFAKAAMSEVYGKKQVFSGPQLIKHDISAGEALLTFAHAESGLVYTPSIDGISGFLLVNPDTSKWLEPIIKDNTVLLRDPDINKSSNIFYGKCPNPHECLFNKEGFHASVINIVQTPHSRTAKQSISLVSTENKAFRKYMNIPHVRRNVFTFDVYQNPRNPKQQTVDVLITLPKEWSGAGIQVDGKDISVPEISEGAKGYKSFSFKATTNVQYVVYNAGKKDQALKEVDISRF